MPAEDLVLYFILGFYYCSLIKREVLFTLTCKFKISMWLYSSGNFTKKSLLIWYYITISLFRFACYVVPPSINGADEPEEVTVLVNKTTVMECVATGSPAPSITWQKDGQLLAEDDHHKSLSGGRMLQVKVEGVGRTVKKLGLVLSSVLYTGIKMVKCCGELGLYF